jgi:hypothetical protein
VHGFSKSLLSLDRCTICRTPGVYTGLKIESEYLLHVFCKGTPDHVYNPCGHATDEESAKVWAGLGQPTVDEGVHIPPNTRCCPFCRLALEDVELLAFFYLL